MGDIFDQIAAQQNQNPQGGGTATLPAQAPASPQAPASSGSGDIFDQLAAGKGVQPSAAPAAQPFSWLGAAHGVAKGWSNSAADAFFHAGSAIIDPVSAAAGHLTNNAVGDKSLSMNPIDALAKPTPEPLKNTSTSEKVGGFGEGVGEFLAGGEVADLAKGLVQGPKLLTFLAEHPGIAKAVDSGLLKFAGRTAEQGVIGGGQAGLHGESMTAGAVGGAVGSGVGEVGGKVLGKVLGKGTGAVAEDGAADGLGQIGKDNGIPLSYGQATGNKAALAAEDILRNTPVLGQGEAAGLAARQKASMTAAAKAIGESLDSTPGAGGSQVEQMEALSSQLNMAHDIISDRARGLYKDVEAGAAQAGVKVPISDALKTRAQGFIDELTPPEGFGDGLKDVDGRQQVIKFLKNFTESSQPSTSFPALAQDASGKMVNNVETKTLPFADALNLKRQMGDWAYSGEAGSAQGALQKMTGAFNDAIKSSLEDAGGDLSRSFDEANRAYTTQTQALKDTLVKQVIAQKPNSIGAALTGNNGMYHLTQLKAMLKEGDLGEVSPVETMQTVQRSLWDYMVGKSTSEVGGFDGYAFANRFGKIDDKVLQGVFGSTPAAAKYVDGPGAAANVVDTTLPRLRNFVKLVGQIAAPPKNQATAATHVVKAGVGYAAPAVTLGASLFHFSPMGIALTLPLAGAIKVSSNVLFKNPDLLLDVSKVMKSAISASHSGATSAMWERANRPILQRIAKAAAAKGGSDLVEKATGPDDQQ